MPELRWTLLILGALFIGGLALWEWRRQRHARGPDNSSGAHAGLGGREGGERISPTFDGAAEVSFNEAPATTLTPSRGTFREPTLTFPEVQVEVPGDSRDRFADPPVVELDDESLDRLKVEAGEAVDEFSEPREAGEAVDEFSEPVDEPAPAETILPRLSPTMTAPTLAPAGGFVAAGRGAARDAQTVDDREAHGGDAQAIGGGRDVHARDSQARAVDHEAGGWGSQAAVGGRDARAAGSSRREPRVTLDPHDEPTTRFDASEREPGPATPDAAQRAERDVAQTPLRAAASTPLDWNLDALDTVQPIVEWPDEASRKIVALRLVSNIGDRFAGRAVRLALAAEGFVLGKYDIFHKPGPDARAVLSAASLTKPGSFSLSTMDAQRYGGLSLFAVLPGPLSPAATFDELLTTARALNDRLRGALQDERGEPLTPVRSASIRDSLTAAASAAAPVVEAAAAPPVVGSPTSTTPS